MEYILVFIIFFGGAFLSIYLSGKKDDAFQKSWENMTFNESSGTLIIKNRVRSNSEYLKMERHKEVYNQFHPATATYTAATVGGVTTGGWSVQDAHYSTAYGNPTNKYLLWYKGRKNGKDDWNIIDKITLQTKDVDLAKKAGLGAYLDNNNLVLKHKVVSINASAAINAYKKTGDALGASNLLVGDYTNSLLTKGELYNIYSFICGH